MTASTTAPVKRALVRYLRSLSGLSAALSGGIHQDAAPEKSKYPYVTYSFLPSTRTYQFDGFQTWVLVDIFAFAENPVDAENIDSLIAAGLEDAALQLDEQSGQDLMLCRRTADVTMPSSLDRMGRRIAQVGGTYRVISTQNL